MKILIIQLARFGDIYISWPAIRALKRTYPKSEIHLLTRRTFSDAAMGLDEISYHWILNTKLFISPLIQSNSKEELVRDHNSAIKESIDLVSDFCNQIKSENYDWIINLSFSPLSSYLCHSFSVPKTKISGYTRHEDGYLNISDSISGYFFAQVGIGQSNRIHLADIFVAMMGLEYQPEDWRSPQLTDLKFSLPEKYITIHIGASSIEKCLPPHVWVHIINEFNLINSEFKIVIIGSQSERFIADEIIAYVDCSRLVDLVAKTQINELFSIINHSDLLIGCDSAPIHIAALTDTPVYNLSFGNVNFWETGPKSSQSYIERFSSIDLINPKRIADSIEIILKDKFHPKLISRSEDLESYIAPQTPQESFAWNLIKAIYFGGQFPICDDLEFYTAVQRLYEISNIVLKSLSEFSQDKRESVHRLLEVSDEIIKKIGEMVPQIRPLCGWIESQKIMIKPGSILEVLEETISVYSNVLKILNKYLLEEDKSKDFNFI